jgi:transcriptional regulator with XRE-family HTH domain
MTDIEVGRLIRGLRKKSGLTQQELATKLGITWEMISRYERGRSSAMNKILELAEVLETDVSNLLSENGTVSLKERNREYVVSNFVPLLAIVPTSVENLYEKLLLETTGFMSYLPKSNEKSMHLFVIKLSDDVRLKIEVPNLWLKGHLLCISNPSNLSERDTVVAKVKEIIVLCKYSPGIEVIAKVKQWIVDL